ncbi:hypothetical protein LXL04_020191 [Taraxacum kok-saghyz]
MDQVRIVPQSYTWKRRFTVVGTVDSKTRITAEMGGCFTADPPKRVADVDVPASHAGVYRHALPTTTPETVVLRERISTKLSEFLTYTAYQLHTLYPYRNI